MSRIIYCTDLDDTLIYNSWEDYPTPENALIVDKNELEQKFVSLTSLNYLNKLREICKVVAVTSRPSSRVFDVLNLSNYFDMYFTSEGCAGYSLPYKYQDDYTAFLEHTSKAVSQPIRDLLLRLSSQVGITYKLNDRMCIEVCVKKDYDVNETLEIMHTYINPTIFKVSTWKSLIWIVPKSINKGLVVDYLRSIYPDCYIIASGNSLDDYPLLSKADEGYTHIQGHTSLRENNIIAKTGMEASDEILKRVYDRVLRL